MYICGTRRRLFRWCMRGALFVLIIHCSTYIWLVVWNIFYFHIYWKVHHPDCHIFQRGWLNHQPVVYWCVLAHWRFTRNAQLCRHLTLAAPGCGGSTRELLGIPSTLSFHATETGPQPGTRRWVSYWCCLNLIICLFLGADVISYLYRCVGKMHSTFWFENA